MHHLRPPLGTSSALRVLVVVALVAAFVASWSAPAAATPPDRIFEYTVERRGDTQYPLARFVEDARQIYRDVRGLSLGGTIRFRQVADRDRADFHLVLATGEEIEAAAPGCAEEYSCRVGEDVLINDENWRETTPSFPAGLDVYRPLLLNHETGHWIGLDHRGCPGDGLFAPVMMQQSKGLDGCVANGIPLQVERQRAADARSTRTLQEIPRVLQEPPIVATPSGDGYWLMDPAGRVESFGDAADQDYGDVEDYYSLDTAVVGLTGDPDDGGYLASAYDGELYAFGPGGRDLDEERGSTSDVELVAPIVGLAVHPSGQGYWQVASDGGVFSYGDARFHGSAGDIDLNQPIVGMAALPDGDGYWLVASDGGVFTYGEAAFHGSAGGIDLNEPIVGMGVNPDGDGYWLVASDGGVFTYGDVAFHGSAGGIQLNAPVVGMDVHPSGRGYWLNAADGGVFTYGEAGFHGSAA